MTMSTPTEAGDVPGRSEVDGWSAELLPESESFGLNDDWSLVDLVNRLLDKGVVITGEATISVAGVDLVYLGLNVLLTSVQTAREQLARQVEPSRPDGP